MRIINRAHKIQNSLHLNIAILWARACV